MVTLPISTKKMEESTAILNLLQEIKLEVKSLRDSTNKNHDDLKLEFTTFKTNILTQVPQVYNFTEKMLLSKRSEYKLKDGKYKTISLYKKLMSGTAPMRRYWIHSSILNMALNNGWKVTKVYNTLTFTAQRICEDYIQFNQDMRLKYNKQGLEFLGLFHKLMNNGLYGWFCRAIETYQETQLLFSGADSYNHFEVQNDDMCGGKVLQERALLVVQNPHDGEEESDNEEADLK